MASLAVALPEFSIDQSEAYGFIKKNYEKRLSSRGMKILEKVLSHPGIKKRYLAVDGGLDTIVDEDPDIRVGRFTRHAVALSTRAAASALKRAGLTPAEVSGLVINTCTGYICPGISSYVAENLGLPPYARTFDMVGSGCGGALPNIFMSRSLAQAAEGAVVSVSVEISSAAFQMGEDPGLLVSNSIFGDGAAASVWTTEPERLSVLDYESLLVPAFREHIRFVHRKGQLHNQLSMKLPCLTGGPVSALVRRLLERNGLSLDDIDHWAIHPGGEKIINAVKAGLGLSEEQVSATRGVLADYGNMSSPSVLFVLERLVRGPMRAGDRCLMVAFGAGFSAYACLLKAGSRFPAARRQ
jgi:predicted naringenin-chalcone synthase